MWTWIIIILVIAIFTALLFNSVYVSVYYRRSEAENDTELIIKYLFFKKKIPIEKKEKSKQVKKPEEEKEDLPTRGLKFYYNLYKLLKDDVFDVLNYLMKKAVVFKEINIKTDFGCKDAASTGILTGTLNGVFYNIIAFFHNNFTLKDWEIEVNPDFENEKFDLFFDCIVRLKIVHIIVIAFKGIKILLKLRKELKKGRKNDGTSNSRTNGNSDEQY